MDIKTVPGYGWPPGAAHFWRDWAWGLKVLVTAQSNRLTEAARERDSLKDKLREKEKIMRKARHLIEQSVEFGDELSDGSSRIVSAFKILSGVDP